MEDIGIATFFFIVELGIVFTGDGWTGIGSGLEVSVRGRFEIDGIVEIVSAGGKVVAGLFETGVQVEGSVV